MTHEMGSVTNKKMSLINGFISMPYIIGGLNIFLYVLSTYVIDGKNITRTQCDLVF